MASRRFVPRRNADKVVAAIARPQLVERAHTIGDSIVDHVPVRSGTVRRSFRPDVELAGDEVHVTGFGPFWHLLEYGTAFTPAYRPIEQGVRALGLRFEAH